MKFQTIRKYFLKLFVKMHTHEKKMLLYPAIGLLRSEIQAGSCRCEDCNFWIELDVEIERRLRNVQVINP